MGGKPAEISSGIRFWNYLSKGTNNSEIFEFSSLTSFTINAKTIWNSLKSSANSDFERMKLLSLRSGFGIMSILECPKIILTSFSSKEYIFLKPS
jgi:hypothetical protein